MMKTPIYVVTIAAMLTITAKTTCAQKLPNIQPTGILAPANIKIDGKATEWNDQFQAYNKATRVFYTMANNNDLFVLAIHVTDPVVINKMLAGGATLSVFGEDKKADKQITTITFPIVPTADRSGILYKIKDPEFNIEQGLADLNHELTNSAKEIQITGVKEIADTLVSVYNTYNVKVAIAVDSKRELTYELSFPLKYIQQYINNTGAFKYDIKLNGIGSRSMKQITINGKSVSMNSPEAQQALSALATGGVTTMAVTSSGRATIQSGVSTQDLYNPTDFSGTYTLAK